MTGFAPTAEQQAAIEETGGALLVSAAAGSGKTRVLVERLLRYVEQEGKDIDRFLVITYTRAAAAELRERIGKELSRRLAADPRNSHLRRQQTLIHKAQISTVHAFCAALLRESGHLADIEPDFRLCDEGEGRLLLLQAVEEVLERRYEQVTEGSDFCQLVDIMSAGRDDSRLVDMVLDMRTRMQSHPRPQAWMAEQEKVLALEGVTDAGETPWGALLLKEAEEQVGYWRCRMASALELCGRDKGMQANYAPSIAETIGGMDRFLARCRTWKGARESCAIPFPRAGQKRFPQEDPQAARQIKEIRDRCKLRLSGLAALLEEDSAGLLEDMRQLFPVMRELFSLVRDVEEAYRKRKARRRTVDYSDLEHLSVGLLLDEEGRPTELAGRWSERYEEIMVDEYQDTNQVQNAIFQAISREGKNLFIVGDVKQSIYRFRLADPSIFLEKYRTFVPREKAAEGEGRRVNLSMNFRSRGEVLGAVNDLFRDIMSTEVGELDYTDAEALVPRETQSAEERYATELSVLDLTEAGQEEGEEKPGKDLLEARFLARRIQELVEEGLPIREGEGTRRAEYRDVALLLRAPGATLRHYARAFGERGIPWQAEGSRDLFAANEVLVALSFLEIVDNPRQDVPLLSALRSPVYGFSADRLSQLRSGSPDTDFYTALEKGAARGEADCRAFLEDLARLRFAALDRNCVQLLWEIYRLTDLPGIFGGMEGGEERRTNLMLLGELARKYEEAGHRGLFSFLTYLRRLRESGENVEVGTFLGEGGVHILSIHRAKGLEFPVVILGGLSRRFNRADLSRGLLFHPQLGVGPSFLDRERMISYPTLARRAVARKLEGEMLSEEMRLLYVGMTRAKDKLILSCALTRGEKELQGLLSDAHRPVEPQALRSCASMGQWILLSALCRPEAEALRTFAGGEGCETGEGYESRWDVRLISAEGLESAPAGGKRKAEQPEEKAEEDRVEQLKQVLSWRYPYRWDVGIPSKLTATSLKGREKDEEIAREAPSPKRKDPLRRPRFAAEEMGLTPAQQGTALHLVMQYLDFQKTGDLDRIREEIRRLVEGEFITPQQAQAVSPEQIETFFTSPLGREMMASEHLEREFKFSILVPAGKYYPEAGAEEQILLQGVVDCWFETREGITVVDFKTDRVNRQTVARRAGEYAPQLSAYAEALSQVTGKPVTRRCLWFFSLGECVEA